MFYSLEMANITRQEKWMKQRVWEIVVFKDEKKSPKQCFQQSRAYTPFYLVLLFSYSCYCPSENMLMKIRVDGNCLIEANIWEMRFFAFLFFWYVCYWVIFVRLAVHFNVNVLLFKLCVRRKMNKMYLPKKRFPRYAWYMGWRCQGWSTKVLSRNDNYCEFIFEHLFWLETVSVCVCVCEKNMTIERTGYRLIVLVCPGYSHIFTC